MVPLFELQFTRFMLLVSSSHSPRGSQSVRPIAMLIAKWRLVVLLLAFDSDMRKKWWYSEPALDNLDSTTYSSDSRKDCLRMRLTSILGINVPLFDQQRITQFDHQGLIM